MQVLQSRAGLVLILYHTSDVCSYVPPYVPVILTIRFGPDSPERLTFRNRNVKKSQDIMLIAYCMVESVGGIPTIKYL